MNNWAYRPAWTQLALRKDLVGLEIGVAKATNAHFILSNLDIKKLYLIDPYFDQSDEFDNSGERPYAEGTKHPDAEEIARRILKNFEYKVKWLISTTEEIINKIPDESLDFCYIDGDHKYEAVKLDIKLCLLKVKVGGVLGGHDFCDDHKSVVKAVLESFNRNQLFCGNRDWWIIKK
ncbi:MAG: class I SAM-dependent methyltransferase [Nanoarchaeota archaeon]|nr:class I SAM-dependent methyltransferase [Nanoarchaeota archaeon]